MKIAVFPGSFDPITLGHESIIRRALPLFDKIIIAVGINTSKKNLFSLAKRKKWIMDVFKDEPKIKVDSYEGITVDFCRRKGARYILRGLRTSADFEFERVIAQMNLAMTGDIETVFILSIPELSAINSTVVRDIIIHGGDAGRFIPKAVKVK